MHPSFVVPKPSSSSLHMSTTNKADFEFQEMRAQLNAMKQNKIPSRDLPLDKRQELETYVNTIVEQRPSPVKLGDIGQILPGTKWRLAFSTEAATLGDLPRDATVNLEFINESKMEYILQFTKKTLGLNRLVAKSSYTVDVSQEVLFVSCLYGFRFDTLSLPYRFFDTVRSSESGVGNVCL
jgi:hypothetical protein